MSTDPKKIQAVKEWPVPTSLKQLWGFLGLSGYYKRFIKGYARISSPLTALLKANALFTWSPEAHAAFLKLKEALISALVLALLNFQLPFIIETLKQRPQELVRC